MTASDRAIPKQSGVWDERRNTSRVFPVPPDALPAALRALEAFREASPEHARWIEEGYPTLTDDEHVARFGSAYAVLPRNRKARA